MTALAKVPGRILFGGTIVAIVILAALFAPFLAPFPPMQEDLLNTLKPPFWSAGAEPKHVLGTDGSGRDILSLLLHGARVAMYVAVLGATGAMVLGTILALIAGYFGGWVDWLISRLVDGWMAFPPVILSLILMIAFGVGINNVVLAIVLVDWTRFCRVIRSEVLVVRRHDYVDAARLLGFSHAQTIRREILPAVLPLVVTLFTLEMGIAVVVEAILSFVGKSVESSVSAWGVMIADARNTMHQAPWGLLFPMLAIAITVLGFNLLGDGLRRALDPRQRGHAVK